MAEPRKIDTALRDDEFEAFDVPRDDAELDLSVARMLRWVKRWIVGMETLAYLNCRGTLSTNREVPDTVILQNIAEVW